MPDVMALLLLLLVLVAIPAAGELVLRWLDVADPPAFRTDSRFGYLMVPDQSASTRGHRFRINNLGLRGPDIGPSRAGERRILFAGDSITYGGGSIADGELFANRIAARLGTERQQPVTAINVSAPGWGIQNIAAFIAVSGTLDADLIVWTIPSADFRRRRMVLQDYGYPERHAASRVVYACRSWWSSLHKRRWHPRGATISGRAVLDANLAALEAFLRSTRAAGLPVIVAALPNERGYGRLAGDVRRFEAAAQANAAVFVDLAPAVSAASDASRFLDGVHLSRHGHAAVASALLGPIESALADRAGAAGAGSAVSVEL
jgi:lysophospholipase L1-like esterase